MSYTSAVITTILTGFIFFVCLPLYTTCYIFRIILKKLYHKTGFSIFIITPSPHVDISKEISYSQRVISFLIPVVGFILGCFYSAKGKRILADSTLLMAVWGLVVEAIFFAIYLAYRSL